MQAPASRICFSDGALELIKWVALALMTGDHINKYLFNGTQPYLFEAGRMAMPLFVIVLAYNLARPTVVTDGAYRRTLFRLSVVGLVSSIPFIMLGSLINGWYPLNILFTLFITTSVIALIERAQAGSFACGVSAVFVFVAGGGLVEFWWPAVALGVAGWSYFRTGSHLALIAALIACVSLYFINGNLWAMAALPLVLAVRSTKLPIPRFRWAFYVYYPLHLVALLLIRIPMAKAGYMFF